MNDIGKRTI